jgi:prepilin-type N-terminal cleavage/methylation domain-containing protein
VSWNYIHKVNINERRKVSNLLKKDKGFTLIEIVLVLAIAGLLLVIVFLAVQGAQRSRRDQQRKTDAATALAAMESCASSHDGTYPPACVANLLAVPAAGGAAYYSGRDPQTQAAYLYTANPAPTAGQIHPQIGPCAVGGTGTASVIIFQEAGGTYCVHN